MKIGIFGGSFNPIHIGHAMLSSYISQFTDIDKVWLMVTPQNPLKNQCCNISDSDRIRMVEMVASSIPNVITSAFEFTLPRPNFTINTLNALSDKFPNDEFVIIIGADNWACFDSWKDDDMIISKYGVMVYPRKGFNLPKDEEIENVTFLHNAPMIDVSSTFIRQSLNDGINMQYFLPEDVNRYIIQNSLYSLK